MLFFSFVFIVQADEICDLFQSILNYNGLHVMFLTDEENPNGINSEN